MDQVAQSPVENQGTPVEPRAETRPSDRGERGYSRGGDNRPESFEQMLRRFKKGVDNAGILKEVRARSFFESKSQKARRKAAKAARRRTRNTPRSG
jgi:small subunit ribosomal protein S21